MTIRTLAHIAIVLTLSHVSPAWCDQPAGPPNPLAGLPSAAGEHVAKIRSMKDDSWLDLGAPAPDPKYGKARGRSWGAAMPYAPDLHAAFLFGEGQHGWWDEQTGRYMDDLWAYDCNGHRWICIYPGSNVNTLDLKLNPDGVEVDKSGDPIPVAQMVHGYHGVTYDAGLRRFQFIPCPGDYWGKGLSRRLAWLGDKHNNVSKNSGLWEYDVATAKWMRKHTAAPSAVGGFGDILMYVPTVKKTFLRHGPDVWWYDATKVAWEKLTPKGPPPPFRIDGTACYDPKRNRIYLGGGDYPIAAGPNALWIFDVATNAWIDPKPAGHCCGGLNKYSSNNAVMTYDQVNDVIVVNKHGTDQPGAKGISIYKPADNAWEANVRPFPNGLAWKSVNGFYDPELNVHIYHSAGDSNDNGTIWVYRLKGKEK